MTNKPKEILMILQPRAIPEAIDSLNKLDIEKVWFRGYTEMELEIVLNDFIKDTDYDYYWIIADDVIVDNKPLEVLRPKLYEGEVVTGYCNLYQGSDYVNLRLMKLPTLLPKEEVKHITQQIKYAGIESWIDEELWKKSGNFYSILSENRSYDFWKHRVQELHLFPPYLMSQEQVNQMGDNYFQTYFAGWSFTGMSRDFWLNYPFQCSWKGMATDAQFAMRFFEGECGEKIFTHKDSWFLHLKEDTANGAFLKRNWLVGEEEPIVHFGDGKLLRDEIETEHIYPKKD
jgi:hypothetical protein